jgi:hypothetical protein
LRVVEYHKLLKDIQEYVRAPPPRLIHADNLGLVDHARRLRAQRAKRMGIQTDIRVFEKATGLKAQSEEPEQRWRVLISTAPISLTVIAPFVFRNYDRRFLVMHAMLPSTRQRVARGSQPPFCGAGVLLPAAFDLMAGAGALALGGKSGDLPWRGSGAGAAVHIEPKFPPSPRSPQSLDAVVPNLPFDADEERGGVQEWLPGQTVQVFARTVEPKDLEEELRNGAPSPSGVLRGG